MNGLLKFNTLGGNGSDVASASIAGTYAVNGVTILHQEPVTFSAPPRPPLNDEKPIAGSGSKDLGQVESGDTVTLTDALEASAHAHRRADTPGTFETTATSEFDKSLGFSVALVSIPEPQTYVLMLAGLTLIVIVVRRKSR